MILLLLNTFLIFSTLCVCTCTCVYVFHIRLVGAQMAGGGN